MLLFETIDQKRLEAVANCVNLHGDGVENGEKNDADQRHLVQGLHQRLAGTQGTIAVEYKQRIPGFGRFYAQGPSIQRLNKTSRCYVLNGRYVDVDMVNCHPTLLLNDLQKHKIEMPQLLADYVADREAALKKYGFRDKKEFMVFVNSDVLGERWKNNTVVEACHKTIHCTWRTMKEKELGSIPTKKRMSAADDDGVVAPYVVDMFIHYK